MQLLKYYFFVKTKRCSNVLFKMRGNVIQVPSEIQYGTLRWFFTFSLWALNPFL